jgi:uncharacterized protein YciI
MNPLLTFISTLRPTRPDFLGSMTPGERAVMEQHLAYVQQLYDQGQLLLGGAATDGALGVLIYRVETAAEAERIFNDDPAVRAGIGDAELHPFRVVHLYRPEDEGSLSV